MCREGLALSAMIWPSSPVATRAPGLSVPILTTRIRWFSPAFTAEPGFAAARGSVVKV
jgi:hypothetical protein